MTPVVEIVTFVATEAYKKDRSVTNPAAELLQSVPGFIKYVHLAHSRAREADQANDPGSGTACKLMTRPPAIMLSVCPRCA